MLRLKLFEYFWTSSDLFSGDYFWTSLYSVLGGTLLDLPLPVPWWLILKPHSTLFSREHFWTYLYLPQSFRAGGGGGSGSGRGPQEYILLLLVLIARQKHLFLSVEQSHNIPLQKENNFTQYCLSFLFTSLYQTGVMHFDWNSKEAIIFVFQFHYAKVIWDGFYFNLFKKPQVLTPFRTSSIFSLWSRNKVIFQQVEQFTEFTYNIHVLLIHWKLLHT